MADDLIRRVHAWLLSPSSPLYSPLLLAVVHTSLTKVFLQLLAELRALDATIVSACPASIVVSTRKHNAAAARAYVAFLVDTVSQRSLFQWVYLRPCRAFAVLLWRDAFNYSGIQVPVSTFADPENPDFSGSAPRATPAPGGPPDAGQDAERDPGGDEEEQGAVYVSEWNIREWLPQAVHRYFDDIVERFVTKPYGVLQEEIAGSQVGALSPDLYEVKSFCFSISAVSFGRVSVLYSQGEISRTCDCRNYTQKFKICILCLKVPSCVLLVADFLILPTDRTALEYSGLFFGR